MSSKALPKKLYVVPRAMKGVGDFIDVGETLNAVRAGSGGPEKVAVYYLAGYVEAERMTVCREIGNKDLPIPSEDAGKDL